MKKPTRRPRGNSVSLAGLKERLLRERLAEWNDSQLNRLLRLAAGEAEALAWQTSVPFLVLPSLLEEKLEGVRQYSAAQSALQRRLAEEGPPVADTRPAPG